MKKVKKRVAGFLLAICMILSCVSVPAQAAASDNLALKQTGIGKRCRIRHQLYRGQSGGRQFKYKMGHEQGHECSQDAKVAPD